MSNPDKVTAALMPTTRRNPETGLVEIILAEPVEIVTEAQADVADLREIAAAIEQKIDLVTSHEGAFEEATLEHRLEIGLHISRAQGIFTLSHSAAGALKGKETESLSTVDRLPEAAAPNTGFAAWLTKNVPRLNRPTAYRYATAFRGLGIDPAEASTAKIRAKIKDLRHFSGKNNLPMPTLALLFKAAPKLAKQEPETLTVLLPMTSKQQKLEDAREAFHLWRESFDKALKTGLLDALDKKGLEELKEFTAIVRDRINARLK